MTQPKNDFAFLRKWEKERKENKWRFSFRIGIIQYTLPIMILVTVYDFLKGIDNIDQYLWIRIYMGLPVCILIGLLAGWFMWSNNEKRYKALKGQDNKKL
ncbi:hypothetical protein [Solitalea lacus]|uniref:hypothetical protein n=1 Tax=Solitalea lacus TaxID=2911172 RepID=UPI001EDAB7CF|nr:hypothetical protein [Solitalea lacus]UKJ08717.1 hypothetical protein L2B55_05990 [Solitalea lacus]